MVACDWLTAEVLAKVSKGVAFGCKMQDARCKIQQDARCRCAARFTLE